MWHLRYNVSHSMAADERDVNKLIATVMELALMLVNFGFYSNVKDIKDLVMTITNFINSK